MQVHIMGASGAGTTTLGAALGERYAATHLDTDDYFWMPTDPPFEETRPMPERLELLTADLDGASSWALSGSICGWGDPLIQRFELVVFLQVPTELRLARLRDRETMEFGAEALAPGGRMHRNHVEFMEWAAGYDDGDLEMRSLARHTAWLEGLRCPVLRLDGEMTIAKQLDAAESMLAGGRP